MTEPLLILDLDETLIFGTETPLDRYPDLGVGSYAVYLRPHLAAFLAAVGPWYRVAVWTSATESYARPIANAIFPCDLPLEFLWCRERCTWCRDPETHEEYWLKNLRKVKRLGYDLDQVLFVDDEPRKLEQNYGNHIHIQPYRGALHDEELLWLAKYLGRIAFHQNLRSLEKRRWRTEITAGPS